MGWLKKNGHSDLARRAEGYGRHPAIGADTDLRGPVGERNAYRTAPRGRVLAAATSVEGMLLQLAAIMATGNTAFVETGTGFDELIGQLPPAVRNRIARGQADGAGIAAVLVEGDKAAVQAVSRRVAGWTGPIVTVQGLSSDALVSGKADYALDLLVTETSISTNTAAAGGNASLMAMV